jgi:hypothetical protein
MSNVKQASKRRRRNKAVPVLGVAGLSLAAAGGASAATTGQVTDPLNTSPRHEVFLGEEEISDVSLSTFYVFDKENAAKPQVGDKLAWGRCGGCRCGGCRCGCGWRGCGGCGGCGGCCWSWGRCRAC